MKMFVLMILDLKLRINLIKLSILYPLIIMSFFFLPGCKKTNQRPNQLIKLAQEHLPPHQKKIAFKNKFVALGGINKINIKKTKMLDVYGISGISMYKKKPALKKAGFFKK